MKIVKFKNGKYGIRRFSFFEYQFATPRGNFLSKDSGYIQEFDKLEQAEKLFATLKERISSGKDMGNSKYE